MVCPFCVWSVMARTLSGVALNVKHLLKNFIRKPLGSYLYISSGCG